MLLGPWSGRSEATITSGVPPPASIGEHADAGSVPSRDAPATVTHAARSPTASACTGPIGLRDVTLFVRGSIRETVPSV